MGIRKLVYSYHQSSDWIQVLPAVLIMPLAKGSNLDHTLHVLIRALAFNLEQFLGSLTFMTLNLLKTTSQLFVGCPSMCACLRFPHISIQVKHLWHESLRSRAVFLSLHPSRWYKTLTCSIIGGVNFDQVMRVLSPMHPRPWAMKWCLLKDVHYPTLCWWSQPKQEGKT